MLGGIFALFSAASFAAENAAARRGVITASVAQALAVSIPLGVPILLVVVAVTGSIGALLAFSPWALLCLSLAGVLHFVWGRYCNYRAQKAIGAVLAAPVQQSSLLVTLLLSIVILGEYMTPLRVLGLVLVVLGPALAYERAGKPPTAAPAAPAASAGPAPQTGSAAPAGPKPFEPKYAEGYFFGILSTLGYGVSPILVSLALESRGLQASLAGGLVSYVAATVAFAAIMLLPGQLRHVRMLDRDAARWFLMSGVFVCTAQMFRYMALALAPASVVTPILRLSMIFRFHFARLFNPHHEVFGGKAVAATVVSLVGALALSVSVEAVQAVLPLPGAVLALLNWRWP